MEKPIEKYDSKKFGEKNQKLIDGAFSKINMDKMKCIHRVVKSETIASDKYPCFICGERSTMIIKYGEKYGAEKAIAYCKDHWIKWSKGCKNLNQIFTFAACEGFDCQMSCKYFENSDLEKNTSQNTENCDCIFLSENIIKGETEGKLCAICKKPAIKLFTTKGARKVIAFCEDHCKLKRCENPDLPPIAICTSLCEFSACNGYKSNKD